MNRAERRGAGIKSIKQPVYKMTPDAIEKIRKDSYQKAYTDATDTAMVLLLSIPVRVMHEQYGWGAKRLTALGEALIDEYQCFSDGEMTLEQYQDYVFKLTGMKFKINPEAE